MRTSTLGLRIALLVLLSAALLMACAVPSLVTTAPPAPAEVTVIVSVPEPTQIVEAVVTATSDPTASTVPTSTPVGMTCDAEKTYYYMALEQPLYIGPGTSYLQTEKTLERGSVVVLAAQPQPNGTVWGLVAEVVYPIRMDLKGDQYWVSVSTGHVVPVSCINGGLPIQVDPTCGRATGTISLIHPATGIEVGTLAQDEQVTVVSQRDEQCLLIDTPTRDRLSDMGPLLCVRPERVAICDVTVMPSPTP